VVLFLGVCAAVSPAPAGAQTPAPQPPPRYSKEARRQAWLRSAHNSVRKDAERVAALAHELRGAEALVPALRERLQALEVRALELQATVDAANEHLLSLQAVRRAEEIKSEARALRRALDENGAGNSGRKLRQLAREMEKRADAVADRIRLP
jgi:hypothetical protein